MRGLVNGQWFDFRKHPVGSWYQSTRTGDWFIVTFVGEYEAVDEYDNVDLGWAHEFRDATEEELAEREREQAEWDALSSEERTEERLANLKDLLPNLDW